jgi:hypothetical protein
MQFRIADMQWSDNFGSVSLLYWYTRSTTVGLSHNAQWMMVSADALSLPSQMRAWLTGSGGSRSLFDHVYYLITITLALINMIWQVRTLLQLLPVARASLPHGRRLLGLLDTKVVQRPESSVEYKSRMSEKKTLLRWPVAVSPSQYLPLCVSVEGTLPLKR